MRFWPGILRDPGGSPQTRLAPLFKGEKGKKSVSQRAANSHRGREARVLLTNGFTGNEKEKKKKRKNTSAVCVMSAPSLKDKVQSEKKGKVGQGVGRATSLSTKRALHRHLGRMGRKKRRKRGKKVDRGGRHEHC